MATLKKAAKKTAKKTASASKKPASSKRATAAAPSFDNRLDLVRELVKGAPPWLSSYPKRKPESGEIAIAGETLAELYRIGFPHMRFVAEDEDGDPAQIAKDMFVGGWPGHVLLRSRAVWQRFVRAYSGDVLKLSSDPRKISLTKEAEKNLSSAQPIEAAEIPALVTRLMTWPGALRSRDRTEDFFYALEALFDTQTVCDAIVRVLEAPPAEPALPQILAVAADTGIALGFLRLRLGDPERQMLDRRLAKVLSVRCDRYPIPSVQLEAFLHPEKVPAGALRVGDAHLPADVAHTHKVDEILKTISSIRPRQDALYLVDPRLVFLAKESAVPIYLSKFASYEVVLAPKVAPIQLGAFVNAIAPFRDPRVSAWLTQMQAHPIVGDDAKAWLSIL